MVLAREAAGEWRAGVGSKRCLRRRRDHFSTSARLSARPPSCGAGAEGASPKPTHGGCPRGARASGARPKRPNSGAVWIGAAMGEQTPGYLHQKRRRATRVERRRRAAARLATSNQTRDIGAWCAGVVDAATVQAAHPPRLDSG